MIELQSTSEVITELGGDDALTQLTGSNRKAISMWRTMGRFPWRTQLPIIDALRARGKTAPHSLWGMKSGERS
jgi:hypothetical protein